jgi:hypothetical protein
MAIGDMVTFAAPLPLASNAATARVMTVADDAKLSVAISLADGVDLETSAVRPEEQAGTECKER